MSGQEEEQVQVLVVGAGPAGLAAALELAGRGLAPLILERRPASGSHPRATALTSETMQLIRRWGAEPEVRRLGFHCEHAMSIRSCLTGPEIQRVPFPGHVWTCAQDHLETILAQRAAAAGARLRYGAELAGLHPADGGMLASVAAPPGPPATIRARYVVGADGARSAVRQATGIATSRARTFGDWISILFRAPLRDHTGDQLYMVYGIGDPSTGGVLIPTDAADRWIPRHLVAPRTGRTTRRLRRETVHGSDPVRRRGPRPARRDHRHPRIHDDRRPRRPLPGRPGHPGRGRRARVHPSDRDGPQPRHPRRSSASPGPCRHHRTR